MINLRHLAFAAAAVAMLASCAKELGTAETVPAFKTKTVTLKATAGVKTTLSSERDALDWVDGDSFNVFADAEGEIANPTFAKGQENAPLELTVPETAKELYAVYPAKSGNTKKEAKITIPAVQTQASAGVLNGENCPMVGSGEIGDDNTVSMGFKPAAGILAINVYSRDNSKEKNVTKVVVTPYSAKDDPAKKFCGTATVDLTDVSPAFNGTAESVTVNLTNPYKVGYFETGTAADHSGEIYVCLAHQEYYSFKVEVYTDDDYIYSAVLETPKDLDCFDFTQYDLISVSFNIANNDIKKIDLNDYYSLYENGIDFYICDQVINNTNYPEASKVSPNSINTPIGTPGLYFVDNSKATKIWSYASNDLKTIADGVVLVGRYKNYPQPTLAMAKDPVLGADNKLKGGGYLIFEGDAMILNYRIECKNVSYGVFQSKSGLANSGTQNHRFQDCTLVNPNGYLTSFNQSSYCVPKSMTFDNCIIRVAKSLVYGGNKENNIPDKLENITFNQTVIAPADGNRYEANGSLINMAGVTSGKDAQGKTILARLDKLNVNMSYCTVYDYGTADKSRGLIEFTTCKSVNIDHVAFYHSSFKDFAGSTFYAINGLVQNELATGGVNISASYSNNFDAGKSKQAAGGKNMIAGYGVYDSETKKWSNYRDWSATISDASQTVIVDEVDAENDYFPVKVITSSGVKVGGASYDTKYWVKVPAAN